MNKVGNTFSIACVDFNVCKCQSPTLNRVSKYLISLSKVFIRNSK